MRTVCARSHLGQSRRTATGSACPESTRLLIGMFTIRVIATTSTFAAVGRGQPEGRRPRPVAHEHQPRRARDDGGEYGQRHHRRELLVLLALKDHESLGSEPNPRVGVSGAVAEEDPGDQTRGEDRDDLDDEERAHFFPSGNWRASALVQSTITFTLDQGDSA